MWELFPRLQVLDLSHNTLCLDEACGLLVASLARGAFEVAESGTGSFRVAAAVSGVGAESQKDALKVEFYCWSTDTLATSTQHKLVFSHRPGHCASSTFPSIG